MHSAMTVSALCSLKKIKTLSLLVKPSRAVLLCQLCCLHFKISQGIAEDFVFVFAMHVDMF